MLSFVGYLIISLFLTWGFSIAIVEKGDEYPIKKFKNFLKKILKKYISEEFSNVINCQTCVSFYLSFFADIILCIIAISTGGFYFFWPLSGFIAMGITWFLIEFLNALDSKNFNEDIDNENNE